MSWDFTNKDELLEAAWGLIANSYGGDWDKATPEWRQAAINWRDGYHDQLPEALSSERASESDQIDATPNSRSTKDGE